MTRHQISDQLFRSVFEFSPVEMMLISLDGCIISVNRSLTDCLGYAEHELLNLPFVSLIHPNEYERDLSFFRDVVEERIPGLKTETRCLHKDGRTLWAQVQMTLLKNEGAFPQFVIAQWQNITDTIHLQQRYHSVIQHNQAAIISVDLVGIIKSLNPVAETIMGYRTGELVDQPLSSILIDIPHNQSAHYRRNEEILIRHKAGHAIELGMKEVPIVIDDRRIGYYLIGRDISEFKRTNEALQETKRELEDLVRKQQGMIFKFKKINGRFLHTLCDGELIYNLGHHPEMIVGKYLNEFLPEEIAKYIEVFYERAWSGEDQVQYEGELNGYTYLASLSPIRRNGQTVEVIASCIDITSRKKIENELKKTKELLESLFDNVSDGIDIVDINFNIIRVNSAFQHIYQWTEEEVIGKPLPVIPPKQESLDYFAQRLNSGEQISNIEAVRQRKDGELIQVNLTLSPLKDAEGNIFAYAGLTRDVTERKKTDAFLKKIDKLNVVGQLAAGLAHEIRNPLTSIRGFLQLMQKGAEDKRMYVDIMLEELNRINEIITEFLFIAKPNVSEIEIKDPVGIVTGVLAFLEPEAIINNVQFRVQRSGCRTAPLIHCSENQLKQVFINIVKNAIEAMPEGGVLDISIACQIDKLTIKFSDRGIGIAQDRLPKLGEPFYTTKEKGTGLGLMMCYKIIEAHRGNIMISSQVNVGTIVDVVLPVAEPFPSGTRMWSGS